MDFEGQRLAEQWLIKLLIVFATVGFLVGYLTANFALMAYINAAGLAITTLLVVPDWPFFRRHPLNWLPPLNPVQQQAAAGAATAAVAGATPAKATVTKSRKQG
jgi:signal peptidase complex subunit 1